MHQSLKFVFDIYMQDAIAGLKKLEIVFDNLCTCQMPPSAKLKELLFDTHNRLKSVNELTEHHIM